MKSNIFNRSLLVLALFSGAASVAGAADRFYNSGAYVAPGQTGTLVFSLDNDKEYFGFQAEIELPENYEFVTVNGKADAQLTDRAGSSYSLVSNMVSSRKVKIGAFSTNHEPISGSAGALLNLRVRAAEGFTGGTLTISNPLLIDATDNDVKLPQSSASYASPNAANITIPDFDMNLGDSYMVTASYNGGALNGFETSLYLPSELGLIEGSVTPATVTVEKQPDGSWIFRSGSATDGTGLFGFSVKSVGSASSDCTIELNNQSVTLADGSSLYLSGSRTSVSIKELEVTSVVLDKESIMMKVGMSSQLIANCLPDNATDKSITWSTSDASIATVSESGLVTAVKVGTATITATASSGVKAECVVTVEATPAASVTLNKTTASLKATETVQLSATVAPETATDKSITWSTSDASVATVSESGLVTAVKVGTATITATASSGVKAECKVTVVATPAASVTLNKTTASLKATETVQLSATVAPETATDKSITWSTSDASVATVSESGLVTAVKVGTATITATASSGVKAECRVQVEETPVEAVELNYEAIEIRLGETFVLNATVNPDDATDKSLTWTSSNTLAATVDEKGHVTAVGMDPSGAVISAIAVNGVTAECHVTVLAPLATSIEISETTISVIPGMEYQLSATVLPTEASTQPLEWTSSDETVATVSATGLVTVIAEGEVVITVTTTDGTHLSAKCMVNSLSGIDAIFVDENILYDIYSINGVCVKKHANCKDFESLSTGVYIINGYKILKK